MKKRIFIAIGISQLLQKEILEWERGLQHLPVRWLTGKNLHITLIPPWYEENIGAVKKLLRAASGRVPPFEIEFGKATYGPDPHSPRLIWAEGAAPKNALGLKDLLQKITGAKSEHREWKMHLTLARFKPEDFPSFPIKNLDEKISWLDNVNSFVLMESHLSREGADYEILEEIKLYRPLPRSR